MKIWNGSKDQQSGEPNGGRRRALKLGLGAAGALFAAGPLARAIDRITPTPPQPEGPFYPIDRQLDEDNDLTRFADGRPKGQLAYIRGRVLDIAGAPVIGSLVEIWQASANGRYNHPGDRDNPKPVDPNFQYWGKAVTDADGKYMFKTIIPGSYPAGEGWIRPPHIHYKVAKRGFLELITQMYFPGESLNADDLILRRLRPSDRDKVIVKLMPPGDGFDPEAKIGTFDIVLERA